MTGCSSPIRTATSTAGFCELYGRWAEKLDLVLRQEHRGGEKLFVDYAGDKVPVVDSKTGTITEASIFVAVLGATTTPYADASWNQDLGSWIRSHVRALEFMGEAPAILIPDTRELTTRWKPL